jgi:hypothetical protein
MLRCCCSCLQGIPITINQCMVAAQASNQPELSWRCKYANTLDQSLATPPERNKLKFCEMFVRVYHQRLLLVQQKHASHMRGSLILEPLCHSLPVCVGAAKGVSCRVSPCLQMCISVCMCACSILSLCVLIL